MSGHDEFRVAARIVADRVQPLDRADQELELADTYRLHSKLRTVIVGEIQAATDRTRHRVSGPWTVFVRTEHGIESNSAPSWLDDDMRRDPLRLTAAFLVSVEMDALSRGLGADHRSVVRACFMSSRRVWRLDPTERTEVDYLADTLRRRENPAQRMLVLAMLELGYAPSDMRRVLTEAKGAKMDQAQLRRLVRESSAPKS